MERREAYEYVINDLLEVAQKCNVLVNSAEDDNWREIWIDEGKRALRYRNVLSDILVLFNIGG